ncbi:MAG: hypothetical protein E7458_04635 [Ruminococcaceae bacterium]|nr:hypothetical protein [Oscillospiraceae bacterium]
MSFYAFLPKLLNMSLTASAAILLVMLLRLLLRRAPKAISYALWGVVLFRLLCPVSIGSAFSLYAIFDAPARESAGGTSVIEYIPEDIVHTEFPEVTLPLPGVSNVINDALPQGEEQLRADPLEGPIFLGTLVWMAGVWGMAIYSIVSYTRLQRRLFIAVPLRENIWIADDLKSPFVVGILRPKIYLPDHLSEAERAYIILHEQQHIRRLDPLMKGLGFLALSIHWFNPLVWAAFLLAGRDMEMSCDEAVIRNLGSDVRADYSASLLTLATGRRIIAGTPLAFGEGDTRGRILNLSRWKKPAIWTVALTVLLCAVLVVSILTNPAEELALDGVESVTVDEVPVPDEAAAELTALLLDHRRVFFPVGLDDPNSLSRTVRLNLGNGDFYLLHYQYYSGFSFHPRHAGEDDYRSILTFYDAEEGGKRAWRMEYDFDAALRAWLSQYAFAGSGALPANRTYSVAEVTYESGITSFSMVAGENTPSYRMGLDGHLSSIREHSDESAWTDLGRPEEISLTRENFDGLFRDQSGMAWRGGKSAAGIRRGTARAWRVIYDEDTLYYLLQQKNGELYLAYGYYDASEQDDPASDDTYLRWLYLLAEDTAPEESGAIEMLSFGNAYVSEACLYMNPLSSVSAAGGDSGCRYFFRENGFVVQNRMSDKVLAVKMNPNHDSAESAATGSEYPVESWDWQEFPYTDEEWAALYVPQGFGGIAQIREQYDEILYLPLTLDQFLLRVDGALWRVKLSSNPQMGAYLWSIFSLVPESQKGAAQWEYAPYFSSRLPVFRFAFDLDYTGIVASCENGCLVDWERAEKASDTVMTYRKGEAICWSPREEDVLQAAHASIRFTVLNGEAPLFAGTLYLDSTGGTTGQTCYTASLVGTGLYLMQDVEQEGGVITAVEPQ